MARNDPKSSRTQSSRVTKAPIRREPAAPPRSARGDRRLFWTRFIAGFLVIAMLLPIIISFL